MTLPEKEESVNRFLAWLTSTDQPSTNFSAEGPAYTPVATYITDAMSRFGTSTVTREEALQVPAVLRGRNMIANIATLPMRQIDKNRKTVTDTLFEQYDPQVPNVVHLAMTVEDLLFDGIAWWEKVRTDSFGWPKDVRHVDSRRVSVNPPNKGYINPLPSGFDPASTIYVDGKPRHGSDFIRFDSPQPPLLVTARRAVRRAILLEELAVMYADNPGLSDYFTPANGMAGLNEEEVRDILQTWVAARKKKRTGYVPETLEHHTVQSPNPQELQLVSLQAKASLDIANALGVDPEDLGVSTTSRTYANATDRRQDRVNDVMSAYMKAITDRLNMGDVTKRGNRVVFDLDDYMRADPKTRWETHKTAKDLGATDIEEIREREEWPVREDLNEANGGSATTEPAAEEPSDVVVPSTNQMKGSLMDDKVSATFSTEPPSIEAAQTFKFDSEAVTFAADTEKRTITGTAILYGVSADNGWGTFTFEPGSIEWNKSAVSRVKFLRDHDWGQLLGAATKITASDDGVTASFKVARGQAGDDALALAEDGALDGLSVGVDITEWTDDKDGNFTVTKATLNEVSLTPRPAFEDARLTKVNASKQDKKNPEEEFTVTDENKTPDAPAVDDTKALDERIAAAVAAALSKAQESQKAAEPEAKPEAEKPAAETKTVEESFSKADKEEKPVTVNPVRETPTAKFEVKEKSPYTFDRAGRFAQGEHEFSTDVAEMLTRGDFTGQNTEYGKRVMEHIKSNFDVDTGDVGSLNPAVQRPDMYVDPKPNRTPLWSMINKGNLPAGLSPFVLPKFATAAGPGGGELVQDHTEGVEPESGTFTTTSQTVTPEAVSGKVTITREVFDLGGNPAISNLIWNRIVRSYNDGLEARAAAHLGTLTAAADITLGVAPTDDALVDALQSGIIALNFAPAYDFSAFAVERVLYAKLANLRGSDGRPVFPALGASNANGTVSNLFQSININGVRGVPVGSLPSTAGALNSSWLFDPEYVHGYATAPQRLQFAGSGPDHTYAPVANVDLAVWGYAATATTDLAAVRQVTYDNAA